MEPIQPRRLDPEIVEAINDAVDKAVDKAVRSLAIAAQSRPQGIEQRQAPAGGIGWTGVGVLVAAVTAIIGAVVWQSDSINNNMNARFRDMDSRFQSIDARFQSIDARFQSIDARLQDAQTERLAQFGALRSETNAEFGELRSANSSFEERMLRIENLIEDRWPSAP